MALVPVFLYLDLLRMPSSPMVEVSANLSILLCVRSIYVYLKTAMGKKKMPWRSVGIFWRSTPSRSRRIYCWATY